MLQKKFYNIEDMSIVLGKSIASIYGHLARKQFDAVPIPMKLGRRLAWVVSDVDKWIEAKSREAREQIREYQNHMESPARRRGRPTKVEEKLRRNSG